MPTKLYIYGEASLFSPARLSSSTSHLEYDLNNLLQDRGEVIWDRDEHTGMQWNIDLLIHDDGDIDRWIQTLTTFLQEWGIMDRVLTFIVVAADESREVRRVELLTT